MHHCRRDGFLQRKGSIAFHLAPLNSAYNVLHLIDVTRDGELNNRLQRINETFNKRFCLPQYERDGFVVLEDLFKPEEVDEMKSCGEEYTNNLPPENERCVFSTVTSQQVRVDYS